MPKDTMKPTEDGAPGGSSWLCAVLHGSSDQIVDAMSSKVPWLLAHHGAVLLRCKDRGSAEKFNEVLRLMPGELADYADGISPRTEVCTCWEHCCSTLTHCGVGAARYIHFNRV